MAFSCSSEASSSGHARCCQPTRIELHSSERDEIEEHIRSKAAAAAESSAFSTPPTSNPIANPILRILHPHADAAPTKAQRIGLHPPPPKP
ncbi:hypothetical protein ZWY2020_045459 [Hordeum vulgare]|nr:hypothetical protein ZWY2020_045459 [Hordeum vulgare]